jgi:hypothetical protein
LGFGIKEIRVLDQERGGEAPERIELKRGRRIGIRSSAKVWYHSYGRPSGPGARRGGSWRMTADNSSTENGERRREQASEDKRGKGKEERKELHADASNNGFAYTCE